MSVQWRVYMWRLLAGILTIGIALVGQTALLSHFPLLGAKPDLVLTVVAAFCFFRQPLEGTVFGALAGLMVDMFVGQYVGLSMLVIAVIGFSVSVVGTRFVRDTIVLAIPLAGAVSVAYTVLYSTGLVVFGVPMGIWMAAWKITVPFAAYNMLLMVCVYPLMRRWQQWVDQVNVLPQRPL